MKKIKEFYLLLFLVILIFVINYSFLDNSLKKFLGEEEKVFVERVIDGDTFSFNKTSVRLLGINCPEKGEKYSNEAKEFLEKNILEKEVSLKFGKDKYDLYKRILAYAFYENKNVNLELVKNGLANFYFPSGKDKYYSEFFEAWENCIKENKNLCEKSEDICSQCIELKDFDYKNQKIIFENNCNFDCNLTNWEIKDEGRKKFVFEKFVLEKSKSVEIIVGENQNTNLKLFWSGEEYVWTKTGDTLFLRDAQGKLVLWKNY